MCLCMCEWVVVSACGWCVVVDLGLGSVEKYNLEEPKSISLI